MVTYRCPRCDAVFTPDEMRAAQPAVDCKFCHQRVLLKRTPDSAASPPPPPRAWPAGLVVTEGFEVTEIPAPPPPPDTALVVGDPYRTSIAEVEGPRAGLTITWRPTYDRRWYLTGITAVAWLLGLGLSAAGAVIGAAFCALGLVWLWSALAAWRNVARLHADHATLTFEVGPISLARRLCMPADDVAQVFTIERERTTDDRNRHYYVVHIRDRFQRDRPLVTFDHHEQAGWVEERLESHLGITDRPIEGAIGRKLLGP